MRGSRKGCPLKKIHWLTSQIKIVKFLHICLAPPPQKKNSGSAHAMHYFFLIICFHDNCGIIHVAYTVIYIRYALGLLFFCNQIDRLKLFFNLFFFKLKRHEKSSINKEFQFNVHISCLLNTAKERYLVDSYL